MRKLIPCVFLVSLGACSSDGAPLPGLPSATSTAPSTPRASEPPAAEPSSLAPGQSLEAAAEAPALVMPPAVEQGAAAANASADAGVGALDAPDAPDAASSEALEPGPAVSAGCGRANPPRGPGSLTIRGAQAEYVVTLPPGYDPNVPTPLIFGFHGRGRTHVQFQTVDASQIQTTLGAQAVMVYMKSQGGTGWNFEPEVEPSVEFFEALYPQVMDDYCVDTSRVFLVGHSSGAYFSHILACRFGERFRATGTVAGQLQENDCSGRMATLLIHGERDTVVPFAGGQAARDYYLERNGCTNESAPASVAPCQAYQGCEADLPVQWCQHTEPTYLENNQPTNHGWPSFASQAIADFFWALPPR